mmetsp:Transcript_88196/g.273283  ORF Transcript_88196/g.273283 Transcript_88196/m.273283 type:complete len:230 (-) Transcript_88196:458-1147(-)
MMHSCPRRANFASLYPLTRSFRKRLKEARIASGFLTSCTVSPGTMNTPSVSPLMRAANFRLPCGPNCLLVLNWSCRDMSGKRPARSAHSAFDMTRAARPCGGGCGGGLGEATCGRPVVSWAPASVLGRAWATSFCASTTSRRAASSSSPRTPSSSALRSLPWAMLSFAEATSVWRSASSRARRASSSARRAASWASRSSRSSRSPRWACSAPSSSAASRRRASACANSA